MSDLSKKIVTYEAMEKYTEAIKQYISNNSGSAGSGLSTTDIAKLTHSVGLPIGNTGIHTWENMCIEGDMEEQHVGSVKIRYYDEEYGEYYTINGTYFNVCPYGYHGDIDSGSGDYYVLLIGTLRYDTEDEKHATDASLIGLNIWSDGDSINVKFNIPIKDLGNGTSNNQMNGQIPEYTIYLEGLGETIEVAPNTSVVVNLDGSGYYEIRLTPPASYGYVCEYRIVLKDEYGGYKEILFDTPWGGTLHWANGDAPDFANESNSPATYEINIRLYIDPYDIEFDGSTIASCSCNLWGTYTKYSWS